MEDVIRLVDEGNIVDAKKIVFATMDQLRDELIETATTFFDNNVDMEDD